jgi:hypothetical protein
VKLAPRSKPHAAISAHPPQMNIYECINPGARRSRIGERRVVTTGDGITD